MSSRASFWGRFGIGLEYALRRTGPMSMAPSQLGAFVRSDPARAHANLQYHVQPLSPARLRPAHRPVPGVHRQRVQSQSHQPRQRAHPQREHPRPAAHRAQLPVDRRRPARRGGVAARHAAHRGAAGAGALFARGAPARARSSPATKSWCAKARSIANTIFHPVGTARMGAAADPDAVVDSHLRVRGVAGLRVVDASIMPTITSGNTASPTLMIAEKAARWITAGI